MPCSGKSFWAKKISETFSIPFFDLDFIIESQEKRSIKKIFDEQGETYFRKKEKKALQSFYARNKNKDFILACGGGTPAFFNNMESINENSRSIYLKISFDTFYKRIILDNNRPLFQLKKRKELEKIFSTLFNIRASFYLQANYHLNQKEISLKKLKEIIYE